VLEKGDSEDVAGRLSELESQEKRVATQREQAVAQVDATRLESGELSSAIGHSSSIKDKMRRYLQLKEMEEELMGMKTHIDNKRQEYQQAMGTQQSLSKKQVRELRTESTSLAMQHERTEGKLSVLNKAVAEVQAVLKTQRYANVASEHRSKMIQTHTTKLAAADMDKYHKALDAALMQASYTLTNLICLLMTSALWHGSLRVKY
jgi:DNA repair protein RAD50